MATIAGIAGKQFTTASKDYKDIAYQYATSSYTADNRMNPRLIVQPQNKDDIALTLKYAKEQKIAVAIRTGGHQYSGASSTSAPNIQLDLRNSFQGPGDQAFFEKDGKAYVRTSVSWGLGQFNAFLKSHQVFVPHGQCVNVHLGGHVQTGGYGQLGRSFGLFGDHVISLEIVDHAGVTKEVTKLNDPELFWALLGGSPGNLGVITHLTIEVHRDRDYQGSRGLKALYFYNRTTLKHLLDILVEMSDDTNFPRNYDLCVSVLSSSFELLDWAPDVDNEMRREHPELYGSDGLPFWPRMIIVYAQWVPFSPHDTPNMAWFDRLRKFCLLSPQVEVKSMSQLTSDWIFRNVREFDHPYIKRTHLTSSTTLARDGWADWVTHRIDALVAPDDNKCWLSAQLQCFGGKFSRFTTNAAEGTTSYSWRDGTTLCVTLDSFYDGPAAEKTALAWHAVNDAEAIGPHGKFSLQDKRVLWGSYGDFDLDASWSLYFESREKYERLRRIRKQVDPDGIFTPNAFCVKRAD